jgi:hypothetical protein
LAVIALITGLLVAISFALPTAMEKWSVYLHQESYSSSYPIRQAVGRLQGAIALGVLLTCWWQRLGWRDLLSCPLTRQLASFGVLYHLVQHSVQVEWFPQITSRFADAVGFFLLISFLGWLNRYRCHWAVLPAVIVALDYWLMERLLMSRNLLCGINDDFLCIPDRWPWRIHY